MKNKSFTLVELLIVMGVLAVVVVTILVTLNPSEAGKKSRDIKRMKDLRALEAIILQYINDGNPPICTATWGCGSYAVGQQIQSQSCSSSWIKVIGTNNGSSVNLCNYAQSIPVDPLNGQTITIVTGGTLASPTTGSAIVGYYIKMSGSDYDISVFQESKSNVNNLTNNSGGYNGVVEVRSGPFLWPPQ